MKLTKDEQAALEEKCRSISDAIVRHGPMMISRELYALALSCIQIGYQQAMKHRHLFHHGIYTGPAEATEDE